MLLSAFARWLLRVFDSYATFHNSRNKSIDFSAVAKKLVPIISFFPSADTMAGLLREQIYCLTDKQAAIKVRYMGEGTTFVCGPAGSGKTILGLCAYNEKREHGPVYFVCHNAPFRDEVRYNLPYCAGLPTHRAAHHQKKRFLSFVP